MALQKVIALPNGSSGNYIRFGAYSWDDLAKEASAHLLLYVSEAQRIAAPRAPLCLLAKLRLSGDKFDEYLSTAVLEGLGDPGPDPVRDQLYQAAQAEPLVPGGGLTAAQIDLSDAVDV